jgi:hypothetical protein
MTIISDAKPEFDATDLLIAELCGDPIEPNFAYGLWFGCGLNGEDAFLNGNSSLEARYPNLPGDTDFGSFGIVPDIATLTLGLLPVLAASERKFIVLVNRIFKDTSNAGKGGGFRWHKWGRYVALPGDRRVPTCEYLDDEPGFTGGVWVYSVIEPNA